MLCITRWPTRWSPQRRLVDKVRGLAVSCTLCRTLARRLSPHSAADLLRPYALHKQPRLRALAATLLDIVQDRVDQAAEAAEVAARAGAGAGAGTQQGVAAAGTAAAPAKPGAARALEKAASGEVFML